MKPTSSSPRTGRYVLVRRRPLPTPDGTLPRGVVRRLTLMRRTDLRPVSRPARFGA